MTGWDEAQEGWKEANDDAHVQGVEFMHVPARGHAVQDFVRSFVLESHGALATLCR